MIRLPISVNLVCSALLLGGCVSFKGNNLAAVNEANLRSATDVRTTVYSQWTARYNQITTEAMDANAKRRFDEVLDRSGCCTLVEREEDAEIIVRGTYGTRVNRLAGLAAGLTGFTFGAIPSWATVRAQLSAEVSQGQTSRRYDLRDSTTLVAWLPLIVAMPFTDNPIKAERELDENTFKSLVLRMHNDGLLVTR